jgi:hypothetical protein
VITGEFNTQDIANTLYVFAGTMGTKTGDRMGELADGGDIRRVQLAGHIKHAVGVCDDGHKAGGQGEFMPRMEEMGGAGGGDVRGVQRAGHCKHTVGVCDTGTKLENRMMGELEPRAEAISGEFKTRRI